MCDKSPESADINEKMLGKVVYNLFRTESNILAISIKPFSRKVNFRHHTPKNGHFRKWFIWRFGENIGFVGLKSKFLGTP